MNTTLLSTLVALTAASFAAGSGPLETVEAYVEAHNRHDIEAVVDLLAPGIVFVMPDGETREGLEQMTDLEAWDSVLESYLEVSGLEASGNAVVAGAIVENNLWFELSGLGPVTYGPGARFEVVDDRISRIEAAPWQPEAAAEFTDFMNRFFPWAAATHPQEVAEAMPGGRFRYDGDAAKIWIELLVEWRDHIATGNTPQ